MLAAAASTPYVPSFTPFMVKLDFFSGPLDLLLHLVRRREVSIEAVEMAEVCDQFVEIIASAAEIDLDVAAEYLVVAATLVAIKSESVLSAESLGFAEDELGGASEFYEELRERLRRYEQIKERAVEFSQAPQLGVDVFARRPLKIQEDTEPMVVDETPDSLAVHLINLLKRIGTSVNSLRIDLEPISVVDYMMRIIDTLQGYTASFHGKKSFWGLVRFFVKSKDLELAADADAPLTGESKGVMIGSFIALLELVKRGVVHVNQAENSGEIELKANLVEGEVELDFTDYREEEQEEDKKRAREAEQAEIQEFVELQQAVAANQGVRSK